MSEKKVTSSDFRDSSVAGIEIQFDWPQSAGCIWLSILGNDGVIRRFRLDGVSEFCLFEDFQSQHISQCTLINDTDGVYLSLDPYFEGDPSDRDCFYFKGKSLEAV